MAPDFGGSLLRRDLLFRPQQDARAQLVGLHQAFHESDLVNACGEEESREFREIFFAQVASAVEIVAPHQVAGGKVAFVGIDIAGEASGDRPYGAGIERFSSVACDISRATRPLPSRNG